jgi:ATP-dependent RNA helicase DDX3X
MADQLNMGGLNLGSEQNQPRSYIPPHMRGKMGPANGAPAGPPMNGPPPGAMNGLNNSAWAGYVHCALHFLTSHRK